MINKQEQLNVIYKSIEFIGINTFLKRVDFGKCMIAMLEMQPDMVEIIFSGFNTRTRNHFETQFKELESNADEIEKAILDIYTFIKEFESEMTVAEQ